MNVSEIDTPALLVDLDIFERNLERVAGYARQNGLRLRPHTKTHKSIRVGTRQLQSGAVGLTVAKVGEAEVTLGAEPADMRAQDPRYGRARQR
jgi:D-serine deaminase-like pyridoxal phosphate-dependent protein